MTIEEGDVVEVHYTGKLPEGDVFDTSREEVAKESGIFDPERTYEPLEFQVGAGEMIEGFEEGILELTEGDREEIEMPPEKAYGEHDPEQLVEYEYDEFEDILGQEPEEGMCVQTEGGAHGDITEVEEDSVTIDFNPHLAGETLMFDIEVLDVK
ncbi:MAG: peptidylprolyl isomerase [Halobacteria archaeon]